MFVTLLCMTTLVKTHTMNTSKPSVDTRQEKIATIAAFTARGDLPKLEKALNDGLDAGLTISEIKEILIQLYAYTGFPRSLNGIQTFMTVLAERQRQGVTDPAGESPALLAAGVNRDEYGEKVRMTLSGITELPPKSGYQLFASAIDTFLKDHLFADIFSRGVLDYTDREIATISALAALSGTENQLHYHLNAAMNVGVTRLQLEKVVNLLNDEVGTDKAETTRNIYKKVLEKSYSSQ